MNLHPDPDDTDASSDPGLSALYRRGATQEPPADLDRRILAQAKAAISTPRTRWWRQPWQPRWLARPLTAVAGLLLALGLAWQMLEEIPPELELTRQTPRPGLVRPAPAPETALQGAADATLAAPPAMGARPTTPAAKDLSKARQLREAAKTENAGESLPTEALKTLQTIRQLVREGHREAAIEQLAAFRRTHPQYPLPDDLASLVKAE